MPIRLFPIKTVDPLPPAPPAPPTKHFISIDAVLKANEDLKRRGYVDPTPPTGFISRNAVLQANEKLKGMPHVRPKRSVEDIKNCLIEMFTVPQLSEAVRDLIRSCYNPAYTMSSISEAALMGANLMDIKTRQLIDPETVKAALSIRDGRVFIDRNTLELHGDGVTLGDVCLGTTQELGITPALQITDGKVSHAISSLPGSTTER